MTPWLVLPVWLVLALAVRALDRFPKPPQPDDEHETARKVQAGERIREQIRRVLEDG